MNNFNQKIPFFLSLNNGLLQLIGGKFEKNRFQLTGYAFAKTPVGACVQGEIKQPEKISGLIITLINQSRPEKIKNNACYVSLPDQYIFSKLLILPKLKEEEVEAAVSFKMKDFLPYKLEEVYLDWQKVREKNDLLEVSVVAVSKKIIDSYLETMKRANLFLLGFEPESSSLARLAGLKSLEPSLVIFHDGQQVVFSFVERLATLLVRVINLPPQQKNDPEVLLELGKSIKFWQSNFGQTKKIKNVFSYGFTENEFGYNQLTKENLGLSVQKLPLPINLPQQFPAEGWEKLAPLFSLAMAEMVPSYKFKRIILLPKEIRKVRADWQLQNKIKKLLHGTSIFLWILLSVYFFVFLSFFFALEKTKASLSGWEKTVVTKNQSDLEQQINSFNRQITTLDQALKKRQIVSSILLDFSRQFKANILVTEFNFDSGKSTLQIKGTANSREDITALEKSLAKLGQVSIPMSSFEQSQSPRFTALIKLNPPIGGKNDQ